jgi:3-oxoadipate CoA-transferase alpha subunit
MGKVCTAAEAMADVRDGALVAAHNWGAGTPGYLYRALVERGVKDLTVCFNNFLPLPEDLRESGLPDATSLLPQARKVISAFIGTRAFGGADSDFLGPRLDEGSLDIESTTHGVLIERLHAGAVGLGGVYSPVGVGTRIAAGKETRVINGVEYILEEPMRPDVGLVKADKADTLGNLVYRGSARGANPVIAMASKYTIAEVFDVVEPGELDPDHIVTPGIYVDRIVKIPEDDLASRQGRMQAVQAVITYTLTQMAAAEAAEGGE